MSNLKRRHVLAAFGALPLVLAGCGGGGGGGSSSTTRFQAKAMVDNLADHIILQTYTNLNAQAVALVAAVQAVQAAPTDEGAMDAAQAAWKATRVPWESSEGFLFGPVDVLGIDPAIDSWPLDTATLLAFMATNPDQTAVEGASDDVRGFHAMEYLLFGDGTLDNDKLAAELTPAEINYLVALAQAFQARTQQLKDAWATDFDGDGPYATQLKSPGAGATYNGYSAVVEELVNALSGIAGEVGSAKIGEPLGTSIGTFDTTKVESQYSWNSLTDFHNNLQSIVNIYTGQLGFSGPTSSVSSSMNGLYAFVAAHDATLAARVLDEAKAAQQAIALIKGDGDNTTTEITGAAKPFREQIQTVSGRALVQAAIDACATLRVTLDGDVLPLVGATEFA